MLELYGRQWEASYGHVDGDVFPAWCKALSSLPAEKIKRGLDAVIEEGSDYPPNLIKFLRLCKTAPYSAMHPDIVALPKPKIDRNSPAKQAHFEAVKKLWPV